ILLNDNAWPGAPRPGGQPPGDARAPAAAAEPRAAPMQALPPALGVSPTEPGMAALPSRWALPTPVPGPSRLAFGAGADPGASADARARTGAASPEAVADTAVLEASRREAYAGQAMALLRRAQAAGFFQDPAQVAHLHQDTDLAPLRPRED